jgi:hypothetical protein
MAGTQRSINQWHKMEMDDKKSDGEIGTGEGNSVENNVIFVLPDDGRKRHGDTNG